MGATTCTSAAHQAPTPRSIRRQSSRGSRASTGRRCLAYGAPAIAQREIPRVVEANSTGTVEDEGKAIVLEGRIPPPSAELAGVRSPAPQATAKARRQAVAA